MTLDPREDLHALMAARLYCRPLYKVTPEPLTRSALILILETVDVHELCNSHPELHEPIEAARELLHGRTAREEPWQVLKTQLDRAKRALLRAGFEDLGGEDWRPPVGKNPLPDIDAVCAAREEELVKALRANIAKLPQSFQEAIMQVLLGPAS